MTTLTVISEGVSPASSNDLTDYARDLTRSIVATAPRSCGVSAFLCSANTRDRDFFRQTAPQAEIIQSSRDRAALLRAWGVGLTGQHGDGMVHAPSLFAPLSRHDKINDGTQTTVTIHDTTPWTHPHAYPPKAVMWFKNMARRAQKYADAIVVPTHTAAENLTKYLDVGDRIRVVQGSAPTRVINADGNGQADPVRAMAGSYVITECGTSEFSGLSALLQAFSRPELNDVGLAIVARDGLTPETLAELTTSLGIAPPRVHLLTTGNGGEIRDAYRAASAHVLPGRADQFSSSMLTSFVLGVPTVHADTPVLNEIAGDAGRSVDASSDDTYIDGLAEALAEVVADTTQRERMITLGHDRARAFSWREAGERIWQLHAEL
ncbi:glycosyltransferase family 1 protein [Klugiella xanthotipulae]|uniref:Glycosyltransferase involved in cell wall biosynthesis n=2 Tax=Klugiella xanthotipulae TaxID=244735 RepID=A0A543HYJ7_9MICO|nr:glycosyltransferase involved in cell wall biosynthesis [Klugiella xanthotipulae]